MTSISTTQVFRDPLLAIFSLVDPETVLKASRVCKLWKNTSENENLWKHFAEEKKLNIKKSAKQTVIDDLKVVKALEKGELFHLQTLEGHRHAILCFAFSEDELFSGSADGMIKVWGEQEGKWQEVGTLHPRVNMLTSLSVEEGKLYAQYSDGIINIFEKVDGKWVNFKTCKGNIPEVFGNAMILVGDYWVRGAYSGDLHIVNSKNGNWREIKAHGASHKKLISGFLCVGGKIFTGSYDKTIKIWGPKP